MKTAIITGAGTGIGAAAAKRLSLNGWTVVLVGRRPDKLQETAAACKQGSTIVLADDLACPSSNDLRRFGLWKNGVSGSVSGLI